MIRNRCVHHMWYNMCITYYVYNLKSGNYLVFRWLKVIYCVVFCTILINNCMYHRSLWVARITEISQIYAKMYKHMCIIIHAAEIAYIHFTLNLTNLRNHERIKTQVRVAKTVLSCSREKHNFFSTSLKIWHKF